MGLVDFVRSGEVADEGGADGDVGVEGGGDGHVKMRRLILLGLWPSVDAYH